MKNLSLIFIAFLFLQFTTLAQAPDSLWTKTYGGSENEIGYSIQQTIDGGYIFTGNTGSFGAGSGDVYLIKTDSSGDTLWTRTYGGSDSDDGQSVQQTSDGGYIIVGATESFGAGSRDVYLIKTDSLGDTLWTKTFGGSGVDWGYSVQQTSDGGYIVVGHTSSFGAVNADVWLIKTDNSGDTIWTKIYGESRDDLGESVQQTSDGGYIIAATAQFGNWDIWLIKTDSSGDTVWTKNFDSGAWDAGSSVEQTSDGGYIVTGLFGSGDGDVWLIKTDSSGDTLWTRTYGGSDWDDGYSVQQTSDGGYIIVGQTGSFGTGNGDVWLIKTNSSGDTLWTRSFGGLENDRGSSVKQTTDGGYIICGVTNSFGAGNGDVWLIKIAPDPNDVENDNQIGIHSNYILKQNYPNPFNPTTTIKYQIPELSFVTIKVYDVLGNEIRTIVNEEKPTGSYKVEFDGSNLSSGIYFYRLQAGSFVETKKMVLLR